MRVRTIVLALTLACVTWFLAFQDGSVAAASQRAADLIDGRPARSILIIGNSRTFVNDMPAMLRKIADSAGSPSKFQIEASAYPGATFRTHWNKKRSRNLLDEEWDDVILQPESAAQASQQTNDEFLSYGAKLAALGYARHGHTRLVVGWAYDPKLYGDQSYGFERSRRSDHLDLIREMHATLASEAKLDRINVAGPWESVRSSNPSIKLTSDGNHPTVAGTYLYALAVYADLSGGAVDGVTFVPDGLDPNDAKAIRDTVSTSSRY